MLPQYGGGDKRSENAAVASGAENQIPLNSGLPVGFIHRGVLSQTSHGDAIRFAQDISHASGQNYITGGTNVVLSRPPELYFVPDTA